MFGALEDRLLSFAISLKIPEFIYSPLIFGVYHILTWVISVMLPPMAIFFPLFTILEDSGYLPRLAFNMDKLFSKANCHGKQSLTMCMGFGCNAAGVTGCRIIDSKRERLVAILTNSFVPCNGRFPMMIAVITMFFTGYASGAGQSVISAVILVVSIATKLYLGIYNNAIGAKIDSAAMKATGADCMSDCISTTVVLLAAVVGHFTGFVIDGWCGLLVSVLILRAGIEAAKDTIAPLLVRNLTKNWWNPSTLW
jgi:hypothetical protein